MKKRYIVLFGIGVWLLLPFALSVGMLFGTLAASQLLGLPFLGWIAVVVLSALFGRLSSRFVVRIESISGQILLVIFPPVWFLVSWMLTMLITGGSFQNDWFSLFMFANLPFAPVALLFSLETEDWLMPVFGMAVYLPFVVVALSKSGVWRRGRWGRIAVACLVLLIALTAVQAHHYRSQVFTEPYDGEVVRGEVNLYEYNPFFDGAKLKRLDEPSTLTITDNFPVLDGATAAYPSYAAVAEAIYQIDDRETFDEYVRCSRTDGAYEALINGEADIIFSAQPSVEQAAAAKAAGRELKLTPIAREAFVFFVNADNPVEDLTREQIRDIYTKKITNWREVGGLNEKIVPFQRPEGSGSQTIMLAKVMEDDPLPEPLREEYAQLMGGVVDRVADYRNMEGAIGYSFRFYTTDMKGAENIRLLAVDGVAPTVENIRNGTYPYTVDTYAVTAGSDNPNVEKVLDWLVSEQGQCLTEKVGYVGIE